MTRRLFSHLLGVPAAVVLVAAGCHHARASPARWAEVRAAADVAFVVGEVRSSWRGRPLESTRVWLLELTGTPRDSATTDAAGAFVLGPVPPGAYHYASRFSLGPGLHRTVEVDLDSPLRVVHARSVTQLGARHGESDIAYEGQRARGAAVPLEAAVRRVAVDTVLPDGAFDGLALYPILLGRRWAVGQSDTLRVFDTDELSVTRQSFRVVALDTVEAAGEQVPTLRAELSTTQLPVTLWLSEATPHRLLRIASANGETVLVR